MALLVERDCFPDHFPSKPDFAIFADTGWEPPAVYANLEWLESELSFPVLKVNAGRSLKKDVEAGVNVRGRPWLSVPVFLSAPDGTPAGMNWRQCTTDYKIVPIRAKIRELLGLSVRSPVAMATSVEMWLGITTDEAERVRVAPDQWIVNHYPLIDLGMSREDCIDWFAEQYKGRDLPRSACVGCPYRSAEGWLQMRKNDKESFEEAARIDEALRVPDHNASRMFRNRVFLHARRVPLREAVEADAAELSASSVEHWGNECAGICGV